MTFEDRLASIDTTLKAILVALQSGASAAAALGEPAAPTTEKKTRTKKSDAETAAAAPATQAQTVVYWVVEKHNTVYAQESGQPPCEIEGAVQVSKEEYEAKKAEFEKKINAAATQQSTAATAPTATATQAAADTSSSESVTFQQVVDKLTELSKGTGEGQGRAGVLAILAKFLPGLPEAERKVPKLEALKKNAEILAEATALLNPAAAAGADLF